MCRVVLAQICPQNKMDVEATGTEFELSLRGINANGWLPTRASSPAPSTPTNKIKSERIRAATFFQACRPANFAVFQKKWMTKKVLQARHQPW